MNKIKILISGLGVGLSGAFAGSFAVFYLKGMPREFGLEAVSFWGFLGAAIFVCFWQLYSRFLLRLFNKARRENIYFLDSLTYLPVWALLLYFVPNDYQKLAYHTLTKDRVLLGLFGFAYITVIMLKSTCFWLMFSRNKLYEVLNPKKLKLILFILLFVILLLCIPWVINFNASGDTPFYLLSAYSLIKNGDLNIYNNMQQGQLKKFNPRDESYELYYRGRRIYFSESQDRQKEFYCFRAIGAIILALPGVFLAGRSGALALSCLLGAFLMVIIYECVYNLTKDLKCAFLTWLLVGFSSPVVIYSLESYPEIIGAVFVALILRTLFFNNASPGRLDIFLLGLYIAVLPWLHPRYIILSLVFFLITLWVCRSKLRNLYLILLPILISATGYCLFIKKITGSFNPFMMYAISDSSSTLDVFNSLWIGKFPGAGLFGLMLDEEFGLLIYAPVYIISIAGMALAFRRRQKVYTYLGVIFLVNYIFVGMAIEWHAAQFARYLVPMMPVLGIFLSKALTDCRTRLFNRVKWISAGGSFLISYLLVFIPDLRYGDNSGQNAILRRINNYTGIDFTKWLPSYINFSFKTVMLTFLYAGLLVIFCVYCLRWYTWSYMRRGEYRNGAK